MKLRIGFRFRASNHNELDQSLKRATNRYKLSNIGFVTTQGSAAGRPLIYYPKKNENQKELCAKIVGIIRDISNLKISFFEHFKEIILNDFKRYLYLQEITPSIYFYCVVEKKSHIRKIRKKIKKHKYKIQEILNN